MTFTVIATCPRTGKAGSCQSTSTPAVGWRVADVVRGRGVVAVQAHADWRQLQLAKRILEFGHSPAKVLKELSESDPHFDWRQVAILDFAGRAATWTGPRARPWAGELVGEHFVVTGNVLAGPQVLEAMAAAFRASADLELEERLLRTVEAGRDAGGQPEGQTSSALLVHDRYEFPIVNLRVDVDAEPIGALRRIFDWFAPLIPYYVERTLDPSSVVPKKQWLEARGLSANPFRP
ncbi:MAG TPA: DUF1028 domain-containing protein [Burkholderiaceae bacterium]|nr:DUF1028 domain-containing protein [Burkholderiaceae bacterium]